LDRPQTGNRPRRGAARRRVIVSEHTIDEWPNTGLSPAPGNQSVFGDGFIPPGLFAQIEARFIELARQN
jgi:hypothetical protein